LSYDPFQSQGATSGTANVAIGQSTGSQYQGADISDNLLFPESGQSVTFYAPINFASGSTFFTAGAQSGAPGGPISATVFDVGGIAGNSGVFPLGSSGGGSATVTTLGSGFAATAVAAASGIFGPAGFFFVQVPTSGNPVVKVPFFNS
jgi:hypothetical protein